MLNGIKLEKEEENGNLVEVVKGVIIVMTMSSIMGYLKTYN